MHRIAICDDDKIFISYIEKIINQSAGNRSHSFEFYEFCSGEDLVGSLEKNIHFDLLILDMELGGMDGDETAKQFRQTFDDTVLVFCSGVRAPTVNSFKVTPYRYLLKSYSDEQLIGEMRDVLLEMEKRSKEDYIIGHYRKNVLKIDVRNILYAETAKRGSEVVMCSKCKEGSSVEKIIVDDKLEVLSKKFPQFVYAHNSYVINVNHIERLTGNEVYLDNGECLSVSRKYQKTLRESFTQSIAAKYQ